MDFRAERKDLYSPAKEFVVVDVPEFDFLMVDGHGDPNTSPAYAAAVEALYSLSYAVKFASKNQLGRDYVVGPLEGLWPGTGIAPKSEWSWTLLIRQPQWLTQDQWDAARAKIAAKNLPSAEAVRLESFAEGLSVQVLHVGSYDDEAPTIAAMHEWLAASGYSERGIHHEVYLSDARRTAPAKLRTVLRQPVSANPVSANPISAKPAPAAGDSPPATARTPSTSARAAE